jgi:hypothetical protein
MSDLGAAAEMPRYQCFKKVWALKIKDIKFKPIGDGYCTATITPEEPGYAPFDVDTHYIDKHHPEAGGYYVVYEDGYKSFSPAKAFEEGYVRV